MEYITYRQAANLLCMKEGTVRAAAAKGILTKVPTTSIRQLVIKEQVMLFKGKKQIRETMLSDEEKSIWRKYRETAKSVLLDNNAVNALKENFASGGSQLFISLNDTQQGIPLSSEEQQNAVRTNSETSGKQQKDSPRAYRALTMEEIEINHIAEKFLVLFSKNVNTLTERLPELRKKKLTNSLTKLQAQEAWQLYKFIVDIGKVININGGEMFSEVKEIVLSSYPELDHAVLYDTLEDAINAPSDDIYTARI